MKWFVLVLACLISSISYGVEEKGLLKPEQHIADAVHNVEQAKADLNAAEQAILERVNAERTARGLNVLVIDTGLMARARAHARWMATNRIMRHAPGAWENIASGQRDANGAMYTWMRSSGHRANILSSANLIGIGVYGNYYCQQFALSPTAPAKAAPECKDGKCDLPKATCQGGSCGTTRTRFVQRVRGRFGR